MAAEVLWGILVFGCRYLSLRALLNAVIAIADMF
jgi:hypothetical protein